MIIYRKAKLMAILVTLCMLMNLYPAMSHAAAFADISGHWAQGTIQALADQGLIAGKGNGQFQPKAMITRAEYFTLLNRVFGFAQEANITFKDVKDSDWFAGQIKIAVAAGYLHGYADNTARPDANITRTEAATVLTQILNLPGSADGIGRFGDAAAVPAWAKSSVSAAVAAGLFSGDEQNNFRPQSNLTRAEAAAILMNLRNYTGTETPAQQQQVEQQPDSDELVINETSYGPTDGVETISKNVTITKPNTVLRNVVIEGDLTIAAAVGNGDVNLNNVIVKGTTFVNGGGQNSIKADNCLFAAIIVDRAEGTVRIVLSGESSVANVYVHSAVKLEESQLSGEGFTDVVIEEIARNAIIELSGEFGDVSVDSPEIKLALIKGVIDVLNISENAAGSAIEMAKEATLLKAVIDAVVTLVGEGKINNALISVDGVKADETLSITYQSASQKAETTSNQSGGGDSGTSKKADVTKVSVNALTVDIGSTTQLTATVTPKNAKDKGVTWTILSRNGAANATLTTGGSFAAGSELGTVTVRATSVSNANVYGEAIITVIPDISDVAKVLAKVDYDNGLRLTTTAKSLTEFQVTLEGVFKPDARVSQNAWESFGHDSGDDANFLFGASYDMKPQQKWNDAKYAAVAFNFEDFYNKLGIDTTKTVNVRQINETIKELSYFEDGKSGVAKNNGTKTNNYTINNINENDYFFVIISSISNNFPPTLELTVDNETITINISTAGVYWSDYRDSFSLSLQKPRDKATPGALSMTARNRSGTRDGNQGVPNLHIFAILLPLNNLD